MGLWRYPCTPSWTLSARYPRTKKVSWKVVSLTLAAGRQYKAYALDGVLYAKGVTQAICPAGRVIQKLNLRKIWENNQCLLLAPGVVNLLGRNIVVVEFKVSSHLPHMPWETFNKMPFALVDSTLSSKPTYWKLLNKPLNVLSLSKTGTHINKLDHGKPNQTENQQSGNR